MRSISTALLFVLLALSVHVVAQSQWSNNVGRVEAVRIASQLVVGMPEADATALLTTNGLNPMGRVGSMTGWTSFYNLSDGSSLGLHYRPDPTHPNTNRWMETISHWPEASTNRITNRIWASPWGGNGILEGASIQSNKLNILSITFTNAHKTVIQSTR